MGETALSYRYKAWVAWRDAGGSIRGHRWTTIAAEIDLEADSLWTAESAAESDAASRGLILVPEWRTICLWPPCGQYLVMDIPLFDRSARLRGAEVIPVSVTDLPRAIEFYRDVLELFPPRGYPLTEEWREFEMGRGTLALTPVTSEWKPDADTAIAIDMWDADVTWATLRERGVRCDDPVVSPKFSMYAFYDPFGNRFEMYRPAPITYENSGGETPH